MVACHHQKDNRPSKDEEQRAVDMGASLYLKNCASCHGPKGDLGLANASDLSQSKLTPEEVGHRIESGGNGMPPFASYFTAKELEEIVKHVTTLKRK